MTVPKIEGFQGEYRWLSNFWAVEVMLADISYPSVEHAYQAAKTFNAIDRNTINFANTPSIAKQMGKRVTLRPDWNQVKLDIMLELLRQKFSKDPLKQKLLETEDAEIIEVNWWRDTYWGVYNGNGENHLGRLIMRVRKELLR